MTPQPGRRHYQGRKRTRPKRPLPPDSLNEPDCGCVEGLRHSPSGGTTTPFFSEDVIHLIATVGFKVLLEPPKCRRPAPGLLEFFRSSWHNQSVPATWLSLVRIRDRCEEVTCSLSRSIVQTHFLEVRFCVGCGTKVYFPSSIKDDGFVEYIVNCLRGLIDSDCMSRTKKIRARS